MKNFVMKSALLIMLASILGCSSDDSGDCPKGLTGNDCNTKITPSKMIITKIVISQYPLSPANSNFWDNGEDTSGFRPDMLLALTFEDGTTLVNDEIKTDVSGEATFAINPPLVLQDIDEGLVLLSVLDYDGGDGSTSDIMVQKYIQLYTSQGTNFPEVIYVSDLQQLFVGEIHVTYEW